MIERITALYARYSGDDGQETENMSIKHQHQTLQEYADHNGFTNCRFYADDGFSGTNFDRPDFQRMLEDVENGLVGTIIVKDMSRFGRNYILVGQYVELVLPQYDVRVIGVTDNYDSYNSENDMFAFESIFNEMFSADISKKTRAEKKHRGMNGGKLSSRPLYGYKAKDGVYDNWKIDEEAAEIVRLIYDMFLHQDKSINGIAKYLRDNKVLTPGSYRGYQYTKVHSPYAWTICKVKKILCFQEYCGDTINFKTRQISYKDKRKIILPKEERMIFRDKHPAIISREEFGLVQEKLKTASLKKFKAGDTAKHIPYLFKKCFCAMCGHSMRYTIKNEGSDQHRISYACKTYYIYRECESNSILEAKVKMIVLERLKKLYLEIKNNKKRIEEKLGFSDGQFISEEMDKTENRVVEIQKLQRDLYEKYIRKEIDAGEFKAEGSLYEDEKSSLLQLLAELKTKWIALQNKIDAAKRMFDIIKQYRESDFDELTEKMCSTMIEKINISRPVGGNRINCEKRIIDIYICNLGNLSELVDVSYKNCSDRIREIAPQLIAEKRCCLSAVREMLNFSEATICNALREEGINFQNIITDVKKEIIIDSIKKSMPVSQICKRMGNIEPNTIYSFIRRRFNTTFTNLCKSIDKY